jgi:hypothetical protein
MATNKKSNNKKDTIPLNTQSSLSAIPVDSYDIERKLYDALNSVELKKSMDRWLKTNEGKHSVVLRDLTILRGIVEEYLSSFLLLGYTMEGERVILQGYGSPKDKDAVMEFLKNVFIQNHNGSQDD